MPHLSTNEYLLRNRYTFCCLLAGELNYLRVHEYHKEPWRKSPKDCGAHRYHFDGNIALVEAWWQCDLAALGIECHHWYRMPLFRSYNQLLAALRDAKRQPEEVVDDAPEDTAEPETRPAASVHWLSTDGVLLQHLLGSDGFRTRRHAAGELAVFRYLKPENLGIEHEQFRYFADMCQSRLGIAVGTFEQWHGKPLAELLDFVQGLRELVRTNPASGN